MKTRILLVALMVSAFIVHAQSDSDNPKNNLAIEQSVFETDSVYYGCVPCCQDCSVFRTDKPGICPHCGMTLEKRFYTADATENKGLAPMNNAACKPPKGTK